MLPLVPSVPAYRVGTTLDGVSYVLDLRWNGRAGVWFMDVSTDQDEIIRAGIAVVLGTLLGARERDPRFPPGALVASDLSEDGRDAGFDDLGVRVAVYYYSPDEL